VDVKTCPSVGAGTIHRLSKSDGCGPQSSCQLSRGCSWLLHLGSVFIGVSFDGVAGLDVSGPVARCASQIGHGSQSTVL
jgi:hypothetical protein